MDGDVVWRREDLDSFRAAASDIRELPRCTCVDGYFPVKSEVLFMRRGVRSAMAPLAGTPRTPRTPPHGCVPRAAGVLRVAGPRAHWGSERPSRSRSRPVSGPRTRVGDPLVVLGHVERDEPLDGREMVERVQEQAAMLERAPPGFDERVRKAHVDLSDDPLQNQTVANVCALSERISIRKQRNAVRVVRNGLHRVAHHEPSACRVVACGDHGQDRQRIGLRREDRSLRKAHLLDDAPPADDADVFARGPRRADQALDDSRAVVAVEADEGLPGREREELAIGNEAGAWLHGLAARRGIDVHQGTRVRDHERRRAGLEREYADPGGLGGHRRRPHDGDLRGARIDAQESSRRVSRSSSSVTMSSVPWIRVKNKA